MPGVFTIVRCRACGFLYQRPRVADEFLAQCYPDAYYTHQEPPVRHPFRGSRARIRAARYALRTYFGYAGADDSDAGFLTRVWARRLRQRLKWDCPPWIGQGRYLDVGCGSGWSLAVARELGWWTAGIEGDAAAAEKARRFAREVHVGDVLRAPFPPGPFDLITAFHVLEHVTDPVVLLRRMLEALAPGGLMIIEVPNAAGLGARIFGNACCDLDLPRHLSHFTPESLRNAVELAGGEVIWCWHKVKPRDHIRSLRRWLGERRLTRLAAVTHQRLVFGAMKLALEVALPLVRLTRQGEVIRVGVVPRDPAPARRSTPVAKQSLPVDPQRADDEPSAQ